MVDILNIGGPGKGIYFEPVILPMTIRGGAKTAGDVLSCDLTFTDGAVNDNEEGATDSGLANMLTPITATLGTGYFGVLLQDTADDEVGQVLFTGRVELKTAGTPANNTKLYASNGVTTLSASPAAQNQKCLAHTLELAAGSPETAICVFDGINGITPAAPRAFTATINLASVAANVVAEETFTVTGLLATDIVVVNPPAFSTAIGLAGYRVSAANTLALKIVNPTAGALDEGSADFEIVVVN